MNKNVHYTKQFKKDFKLCIKRGYNIQQIRSIMKLLESGKELPEKNKDHNLTGNFLNCRECHVQSDWLLIYQLFDNDIIFIRTGSHSDLFS
ncbi:MAG: type II toxin-antitoxin system YafQ family toxin [Actinobacteria bacterium]|nr:type II toxin-antitoxin system YafQ family toxin [Actinomycetota bacterium]